MKKGVFGTREWASSNLNLRQNFCENGCKYCFSQAMAIRFGRATPETWVKPGLVRQPNKFGKRIGTVMCPTGHDITEANVEEFIAMMNKALLLGNDLLIVTKPRMSVISRLVSRIPAQYREKILFRLTIGSANNDVLKLWEPGATTFEERLSVLRFLYMQGYQTSVSSEPMLDPNIDDVIAKTAPYITDAIWLGKANSLVPRVALNTGSDKEWRKRAIALDAIWTDDAVKKFYEKYKDNPKVKYKESVKKIVGIEVPTEAGLDI